MTWSWVLTELLRGRKAVLGITVIGTSIGLVMALLRPSTYTTSFAFFPQAGQDAGRAGLINLAGQFGLPIGAVQGPTQSPQFYADLLRTRTVLSPIAAETVTIGSHDHRRMPLSEFLGTAGSNSSLALENTIRRLRQKIIGSSVATRGSGVVTVTVQTRSAAVSFEVGRQLLESLNEFNLQTRQSQAGAERRFIEGRLTEARDTLRAAEQSLQRFLESNRQSEEYSPLSFARDRLQRDVTLKQEVVTELAQQYEDARIREVRDTPVLTVIEQPRIAARADQGERLKIFVTGLVLALVGAVGVVLVRASLPRTAASAELTVIPGYSPALERRSP